jgi:hypothetical protein
MRVCKRGPLNVRFAPEATKLLRRHGGSRASKVSFVPPAELLFRS